MSNMHPEQKLWLAVLQQAVTDIFNNDDRDNSAGWWQKECYAEDRQIVCDLAGVDRSQTESTIIRRLVDMVAKYPEMRCPLVGAVNAILASRAASSHE